MLGPGIFRHEGRQLPVAGTIAIGSGVVTTPLLHRAVQPGTRGLHPFVARHIEANPRRNQYCMGRSPPAQQRRRHRALRDARFNLEHRQASHAAHLFPAFRIARLAPQIMRSTAYHEDCPFVGSCIAAMGPSASPPPAPGGHSSCEAQAYLDAASNGCWRFPHPPRRHLQ